MSKKSLVCSVLFMMCVMVSVGSANTIEPQFNLQICGGSDCHRFMGSALEFPDGSIPFSVGEDNGTLSLSGQVDPFQNLGIVVNDNGAPGNFVVALSVPLVPTLTGLVTAKSSLQGGCSDGAPNGCGATPFLTVNNIADFFVNGFAIPLGIPRGDNPGVDHFPGSSGTFPPLNPTAFSDLTTIFDCGSSPGCTSFESVISFTGSGGGDQISFSSRLEINPTAVPEPSTLSLLGLGLLGMGGAVWRRWRS